MTILSGDGKDTRETCAPSVVKLYRPKITRNMAKKTATLKRSSFLLAIPYKF